MRRVFRTVLLLLALGAAPPVMAQEPGYEGSGTAPVLGDVVRARDRALQEALRRAIEQAIIQAAPEERGRLYLVSARARDYVTNYRMLEEGEGGGQFQVRILAQVDLPRLLRDLQVGVAAGPRTSAQARILVCQDAPVAFDERVLAPARELLGSRAEVLKGTSCPAQSQPGAIIEAMARSGAQAALVLRPAAEPPRGGEPGEIRGTQPALYGALARVQLTLYGGGGGGGGGAQGGSRGEETVESSGFGEGPEAATQAAVRAAAREGSSRLLPRLAALLPGPTSDGVIVSLEGIESYADYQRLVKLLGALPGVAAAEPRRFAGGKGQDSQVEVLLRSQGPAEPIGAALGRSPLPGLKLQVMPAGPRRLRVLVVAESALPAPPPIPPDNVERPAQ